MKALAAVAAMLGASASASSGSALAPQLKAIDQKTVAQAVYLEVQLRCGLITPDEYTYQGKALTDRRMKAVWALYDGHASTATMAGQYLRREIQERAAQKAGPNNVNCRNIKRDAWRF